MKATAALGARAAAEIPLSVLNQAHFQDKAAAFESAGIVIWPDSPIRPHCRIREKFDVLKVIRTKKNKKHPQGFERDGLKKCSNRSKRFAVRIGPVFEVSHLPLHPRLHAFRLLCSSKKGIGSNPLAGVLEVKLETARFVNHRIREAAKTERLAQMGGRGSIIETGERFKDKTKAGFKRAAFHYNKRKVLSLVKRGGDVRNFRIT
jgi:hypothetical protein